MPAFFALEVLDAVLDLRGDPEAMLPSDFDAAIWRAWRGEAARVPSSGASVDGSVRWALAPAEDSDLAVWSVRGRAYLVVLPNTTSSGNPAAWSSTQDAASLVQMMGGAPPVDVARASGGSVWRRVGSGGSVPRMWPESFRCRLDPAHVALLGVFDANFETVNRLPREHHLATLSDVVEQVCALLSADVPVTVREAMTRFSIAASGHYEDYLDPAVVAMFGVGTGLFLERMRRDPVGARRVRERFEAVEGVQAWGMLMGEAPG